ncbi:MAG: peptidoglycan editing factor PgeF [Oscillospiraceae bacterium]|nr:peptidoglycan editing factor PgeF [Oscillospiraceae bacterium]
MYTTSPNLTFTHAFTDRLGGVSEGIFASLNLGEHRGDEEKCVRENYRRLFEALGITKFAVTKQVHSDTVREVTLSDAHELYSPVPYEADGLVTREKGLALMVFTADCVPILLEDAENGVIAAVHAGWRGTVAEIAKNAVNSMVSLGAKSENIRAAVGPAIGYECFQVGAEVKDALGAIGCDDRCRPDPENEGKFYADLKGANRDILVRSGVRPENIRISPVCTRCRHDKYWSHRFTDGKRGVQASIIMM